MSRTCWIALLPLTAAGGILLSWIKRVHQENAVEPLRQELQQFQGNEVFDPSMVEYLPTAARRYLLHAITPGTPLAFSVRLTMYGSMRLQPGADLLPMRAEQVLAPPHGFVWKARVGKRLMQFQGFDRYGHGEGGMRWWLYGLLPIVRAQGQEVSRSAAGRLAGEAVLIPAALLPQRGALWESVDDSTANVRIVVDNEPVSVAVVVDAEGRLLRGSMMRWRADTSDGTPGYIRFDIDEMAEERTFDGYTIPTRFRAGWRLGEPDEFPFFYAMISSASYR